MVDLELATTGQIVRELNNRRKSFVLIFDSGSGITGRTDTLECHVSNMNPEETLHALGESGAMLHKMVVEGECPDDFAFLEVNEDGDIIEIEPPSEDDDDYDPWEE